MGENKDHPLFHRVYNRSKRIEHDSDEYQLFGVQAHYPGSISGQTQGEELIFLGRFKTEHEARERGKRWEKDRKSLGVSNPTWNVVRSARNR